MPLIVVCSLKGAPGTTTLAAGLCALWPEPGRVLVEVDPAGGTLAADWRLRARPSLVDVAASLSSETDAPGSALAAGSQDTAFMGESLPVVCAPAAVMQARAAIARVCDPETGVLVPADRWVIADIGRFAPEAPTLPLLAKADAVCVLIAGTVAQIMSLRGMSDLLARTNSRLAVTIAPAIYTADDVTGLLAADGSELHVLGDVPRLPAGRVRRRRALMRSWQHLARSAFEVATRPAPAVAAAREDDEEVVL